MARPLQRRKQRSSRPTIRQKSSSSRRSKKLIQNTGLLKSTNPLVAENWDKKATLAQNYRRLGLTAKLNCITGGVEKKVPSAKSTASTSLQSAALARLDQDESTNDADALVIHPSGRNIPKRREKGSGHVAAGTGEVRVIRDDTTGAIIRVIRDETTDDTDAMQVDSAPIVNARPLDDFLAEIESEDEKAADDKAKKPRKLTTRGIIPQLEHEAAQLEQTRLDNREPRRQSEREVEWIERLVNRWGDNYRAMVRDRKLNPRQQNEGDIRRRVELWQLQCGK